MSETNPVTPRKFSDRSLVQLTLVRFREFIRQPEAVFWTFVFPILLAVGLGLAFRSKAPERPHVGVVSTRPGAAQVITALQKDSSVVVEQLNDSTGARALRTAKIAMLVVPQGDGGVQYVFDPLEMAIITGWLVISFVAALKLFRWR